MEDSPTTNRYVAVVDDDESVCRSFSRLLRASGFQPITYPCAESFLGDRNHPNFDCLVVDVQLTGMSGLELCQRLVAVQDLTPIIVITAFDDPETRRQAREAGSADYFSKSTPGQAIIESIQRLSDPKQVPSKSHLEDSHG